MKQHTFLPFQTNWFSALLLGITLSLTSCHEDDDDDSDGALASLPTSLNDIVAGGVIEFNADGSGTVTFTSETVANFALSGDTIEISLSDVSRSGDEVTYQFNSRDLISASDVMGLLTNMTVSSAITDYIADQNETTAMALANAINSADPGRGMVEFDADNNLFIFTAGTLVLDTESTNGTLTRTGPSLIFMDDNNQTTVNTEDQTNSVTDVTNASYTAPTNGEGNENNTSGTSGSSVSVGGLDALEAQIPQR